MTYLEIKELSLSFGASKVLKNINLTVEKGTFVTLLGPSGCGKSTLLRTIAGLEEAQTGQIVLDGTEIQEKTAKDRDISMVFQSYALFPNMSVFENIAFGLRVKKVPEEEIVKRVGEMLDIMELYSRRNYLPHELSGGQQQRVSLARALVVNPKVLLLDEPLSALDARIRKQLQIELRKIQQQLGITMIFVTHDQEEALILSDQIHVMNEGKIEQSANPSDLYRLPKNQFVAGFIGNYNQISRENLMQIIEEPTRFQGTSEAYVIRPELIKLVEPSLPPYQTIAGVFTNFQLLGNTIRCRYETPQQILYVDLLNDIRDISQLVSINKVYISSEDIIPMERKELA